jgi:GTP cyclohydrolase I
MSADAPCCPAGPAEGGCGCNDNDQAAGNEQQQQLPPQPQQQQQQQQGQQQVADGVQTFSAQFSSQCEHHLLPFYGRLKLAYRLPAGTPSVGSTSRPQQEQQQLGHIVEMFSRRLQVQERLTHQVADAAAAALGASAVLVVVESAHMCMVARGVEKHASTTMTTAARGAWAADAAARAAALDVLLQQQPQPHR